MRKQTGFTLIEILVTVVVLAIGLLGLAGLQATALRFNSSASQRSQATILAYDILEQMRANVKGVRCGFYDAANTQRPGEDCNAILVAGLNGIAVTDTGRWTTALNNTLPSANGTINYDGAIVTITIQWDDSRGQETPNQFIVTTEL
ncbi:MAG: type IV pilus modification protein PilV [Gammaproteobacteria bacterium]|nr:type IV pilus modification protein PilV [Gammaproteobacteria bacterium]